MLIYAIVTALLTILSFLLSWLPIVTELPFGADGILLTIIGTVQALVGQFEFLQVPWAVVTAFIGIKTALFVWHWVRWFVKLVRG